MNTIDSLKVPPPLVVCTLWMHTVYMCVCVCVCVGIIVCVHTVEPLYCGHPWDHMKCPTDFRGCLAHSFTCIYSSWDNRQCPDWRGFPNLEVLNREVPLYYGFFLTTKKLFNCSISLGFSSLDSG